jgi:hypothetical protein
VRIFACEEAGSGDVEPCWLVDFGLRRFSFSNSIPALKANCGKTGRENTCAGSFRFASATIDGTDVSQEVVMSSDVHWSFLHS